MPILDIDEEDEELDAEYEEAPRRFGCLAPLLLLSAIPVSTLAIGTLAGVGLARGLPGFPAIAGGAALIVLPIVGLTALLSSGGSRVASVGGSAWFWSLVILLAMPFYFPSERSEAADAGLRLLVSPIAEESRGTILALGERMVAMLGAEPERLPEAVVLSQNGEAAEEEERKLARAARPRLEGEVVLPYDGDGQIMRVAVFFDGPRYGDEFPLIFDTGATYTTLSRAALERLDVEIPASAPVAVLRTANGEIEAPLVLVDAAWLGDAAVEWVTVAVCDLCAGDDVSGLLGLNVSGQFQVALDHTDHEIRLTEREGVEDRRLDVVQWVRLSSRIRRWRDGRVEVEVTLRNRAHVPISEAVAKIECHDGSFEVALHGIPAAGVESSRMALPNDTDCSDYQLELTSAQWQLDRF